MWPKVINKVNVIHEGQGHIKIKVKYLLPFQLYVKFYLFKHINPLYMAKVINKVKVTHQGEGHIKVKVKYLHPFKFYVAHTLCKRVVCIRLKCYLFFIIIVNMINIMNMLKEKKVNVVLARLIGDLKCTYTRFKSPALKHSPRVFP